MSLAEIEGQGYSTEVHLTVLLMQGMGFSVLKLNMCFHKLEGI